MRQSKRVGPQVAAPFTMETVQEWNEALRVCEDAMRQCELAIQAGFPCESDLDACTAVRDQIQQMKAVYAPGVP